MMIRMELRHLRYFIAVAEALNFTRAAERLRIAQPALSRQMRDLEEQLQAKLFDRTHAGVRLTRAGRAFYARAQSILAQASEAMHEARSAAGVISGRLVIGFPSGIVLNYTVPLITAYRRNHPTVELDFVHLRGAEQIKALRDSQIDVAIAYKPFKSAEQLESRVIFRFPFKAVLPQKHVLARRPELHLADLRHEDFVFCTREPRPEFYDAVFRACAKAGFEPRVVKEVGGYLTNVLALVSVGQGVSVLPDLDGTERMQGITWRPLATPKAVVEFVLLWRRENMSRVLKEFLVLAEQTFDTAAPPLEGTDWISA